MLAWNSIQMEVGMLKQGFMFREGMVKAHFGI